MESFSGKEFKMGKKSTTTTQKKVYGNTTTANPYVTSTTNNNGTTSKFNAGTAFDTINNFVNSNMNSLLDQYLNPSLNTVTNQAKLNGFTNNLNSESARALENNIINPLSNRNMIRSSQATNLYNNLAQNNAQSIANYSNELLANSQNDSANVLNTLLSLYMNGYDVLSDTQAQSLATSQGNATSTTDTVNKDSVLGNINTIASTIGSLAKVIPINSMITSLLRNKQNN